MIGTILNGIAIVTGGIIGVSAAKNLSLATQTRLKILLGAFTVWVGLSTTWKSFHGSFLDVLKEFAVVLLALSLGNFTGRLLRLQKSLNSLGRFAREKFSHPAGPQSRFSEGIVTCSLVFCVGPMAILGALQDGLTGDFKTLAIKSLMDGLATVAFAKTFGWGVILSALPVVAYQGSITLAAHLVEPFLQNQSLLDALNATGGLLIFSLALIILEIRKVEVANYLPALVYAPLLTYWMEH